MRHLAFQAVAWSALLSGITLALSPASFAAPTDGTVDVVNNDGSVSKVRLLPVHKDPAHEQVVRERLARAALTLGLPEKYEIPHSMLPPVRDQGQRGTCAYFATVGILETYYMRQGTTGLDLSEECLVGLRDWEFDAGQSYAGDDKPDMRPDPNGDLPVSIIKTIDKYGVPFEKDYLKEKVNCTYNATTETPVPVKEYEELFSSGATSAYGKALKFDENTAPTADSIKKLIAANIPVEVGILVYNDYMNGIDWRFDPKYTDQDIAGGHAIILTGYGKDSKTGKPVFTFKNSWSTGWGREGFGTVDLATVQKSWGYDPAFDFIVSVHK